MMRYIVMMCLISFAFAATGQGISEADIIRLALENQPSIVIANKEVQRMRALERTSFNPEQPRFEIETPSEFGIGFEVEQELHFPTVYTRRSKLFKSNTRLAEESMTLSRLELIKEIRIAYLDAQVAQVSYQFAVSLDSLWQDIAGQSKRLYDGGEINLGDAIFAQSRSGLTTTMLAEKSASLQGKLFVLQSYAGQPINKVQPLQPLPYVEDGNENYFFEPYMAQQVAVIQNEIKLLQSQRLPDLMIGYVRSTEPETAYRFRYKAGITIPIWQGQYGGEIAASRIDIEQTGAELDLRKQEFNIARNEWQQILTQSQQSLAWFDTTGLQQMNQLVDIYRRLYDAGEINYTQMLRNLADAFVIRDEYLLVLQRHNQAVIQLDYLNGKS